MILVLMDPTSRLTRASPYHVYVNLPPSILQFGRKLEGAMFVLSVASTPQQCSARCDPDCPRPGPCETDPFPTRHSPSLFRMSATRFTLARNVSPSCFVVRSLSFLRLPRVGLGPGVGVIILQGLNTSRVDTPKFSGCWLRATICVALL